MRAVKLLGIAAIVVLSVAAGTVLGILLDRSLLQKRNAGPMGAPATNLSTLAISAAEVPHKYARLSKPGHTPEGIRQAQDFAQTLAPAAFPTAVEHLAALDPSLRQWVLLRIFERWAREDPTTALDAVVKVPPIHQSNCQNAVFDGWSKRDANALIAWAERSTNATVRRDALVYGVRELANQNPKAALAAALKLPPQHRLWSDLCVDGARSASGRAVGQRTFAGGIA